MPKVTIKPLKGDTFEVEYEEDVSVKGLKEKVQALKAECLQTCRSSSTLARF